MPSLRPLPCLSLTIPSSLGLSLPQGPTAGCTWWKTITGPGRLQFSAVLTGSENYLHSKPTFCCDSELRSPVIHPDSFPGGSDVKESAYNVGDPDLIPVSGRSSGEWNCSPQDLLAMGPVMPGVLKTHSQKSNTKMLQVTDHFAPPDSRDPACGLSCYLFVLGQTQCFKTLRNCLCAP